MNCDIAIDWLLNHASLRDTAPIDKCLAVLLWRMRSGQAVDNIDDAFQHTIACLECINLQINGSIPSQTNEDKKSAVVERKVVHAVSLIINDGWRTYFELLLYGGRNTDAARIRRGTIFICLAWSAVVAGDSDSIRQDMTNEYAMWRVGEEDDIGR